jgi:hypothetical protein
VTTGKFIKLMIAARMVQTVVIIGDVVVLMRVASHQ